LRLPGLEFVLGLELGLELRLEMGLCLRLAFGVRVLGSTFNLLTNISFVLIEGLLLEVLRYVACRHRLI